MNNNQTIEKLRQMRISAMAELHEQQVKSNRNTDLTADEYLALLTDHEWEDRQNKKTTRLLKQAKLRQKTTIADISYSEARNLDKNLFERIATLDLSPKKKISLSQALQE